MRFVARRIVVSVALLFGTSILIFVAIRALPGNPVAARLGLMKGISGATLHRLVVEAGLDRSLVSQYLSWIAGAFRGNLGTSYYDNVPVSSLISQRFPPTFELTLLGVGLSIVIGVPSAIVAAWHVGSWVDRTFSAVAATGMAFPPFVAGIILIVIFSVSFHLLPSRGYVPLWVNPIENLQGMILPALSLSIVAAPLIFRFLRGAMIDALASDFARTAEGKGASPMRVVFGHALRNAALPAVTVIGLITGYTIGGSVIVEYVFGFSGLGSLAVESASERDYAVLQSVVLLISAEFIIVMTSVDLLVWRLDPRTRKSRG